MPPLQAKCAKRRRFLMSLVFEMAAALCAHFVKGLCGFGDSIVFSTALAFFMPNVAITPLHTLVSFAPNPILLWQNRKYFNFKQCLPLAVLVLLGDIPGIFLLRNMDTRILKMVFGGAIVLISLDMLRREKKGQWGQVTPAFTVFMGLLSGLTCGLFSIGVTIAAYMGRLTQNPRQFRANINFLFMVDSIFRTTAYILTGIITWEIALRALELIPCMLAGVALGMRCSKKIDDKKARLLIILLLIVSGVMLIINNL